MKRILMLMIVAVFVLSACSNSNTSNVPSESTPKPTANEQALPSNEASTDKDEVSQQDDATEDVTPVQFLQKAKLFASELESVNFYTM